MEPARRANMLARAFAVWVAAALLVLCGVARASEPPPPQLAAREALLVETDTGTRVLALHAGREVAIASTTKLMTAYVTLQTDALNQRVRERPYAPDSAGQSLAGLPAGARFSIADMLRAMLLPSGNDVAHSLAIDIGGTSANFVALMNAAAVRLGLRHTHYATPIGLDTTGNYSSAANLETLAATLMRDPFFAAVVRERVAYLPHGVEVVNTNDLLGYPFVVGVKTGHTEDAGYCLVGAASWHGVHLISVVLGDPSEAARDDDTLALLRYGLSLYHRVHVAVKGRPYYRVRTNGSRRTVALVASRGVSLVVRRSPRLRILARGVPGVLNGPLRAGAPAGELEATDDGKLLADVGLVTQSAVADPPSSHVLLYALALLATTFVAGCSLRSMRRRAAGTSRPRARA